MSLTVHTDPTLASVTGLALIGVLGLDDAKEFARRHQSHDLMYSFVLMTVLTGPFQVVVEADNAHRNLEWPAENLVALLKKGHKVPTTKYVTPK